MSISDSALEEYGDRFFEIEDISEEEVVVTFGIF